MSTQAHTDAPSWVQRDPACLMAWEKDPSWRRSARGAVPPNGRKPGDGGTTGDALRLVAAQQLARRRRAAERQRKEQDPALLWHHAEACICPTCRKSRGEYVPTLHQLQEKRKRAIGKGPGEVGYEPGDREEWLLSSDARARFAQLCEVFSDGAGKDFFVVLRTALVQHLDAWRLFGALERLLEERPSWGSALVACDLQGRPAGVVAREEDVPPKTVHHRRRCARRYLAALYAGEEPQRTHSPGAEAHTAGCAGTGATLAALEEAARVAQCSSVADYVRRIVLDPL